MRELAGLRLPNVYDREEHVVHRHFHNRVLLPVVIIFLALSYLSVALRLWTRTHFLKRLGWDDYIIIVTLLFFSVSCASMLTMFVLSDDARGFSDIPLDHIGGVAALLIVTECFYVLSMIALKLSLAVFFLRVLVSRWQRWIIIVTITMSTTFGMAFFFFAIFQCGYFSNIHIFIQRLLVPGQCVSPAVGLGMNYTYAALATTSDWACILIPIFILRESTMPLKRKLIVGGLMIFASLGSIASIVRMLYLHNITIPTGEFFVSVSKLSIWSTVEPGVGITVASLATLRPLFLKLVEKTRRGSVASDSSPHPFPSPDAHTSATSQAGHTKYGSTGMSSDTTITVSQQLPHRSLGQQYKSFSKYNTRMSQEEKIEDIEVEMRAYGMSGIEKHTSIDDDDFDHYTPQARKDVEVAKRMRWFQGQRAMRSSPLSENISRTAEAARDTHKDSDARRQVLNDRVVEWRDEFAPRT